MDTEQHTFQSPKFESVIQETIRFMMASPVHPLPPANRFPGAGVYAIYYVGPFEHYQTITAANRREATTPIYIGKAVPPGWRVGRAATRATDSVRSLYRRLVEHANNIKAVKNLDVSDFRCRFMILGGIESDLISACEAQLIRRFKPLWNTMVDGFGNHTPGEGRFDQARSEWDVLHPGRAWAARCRGTPPVLEDIVAKIARNPGG
ncbi:MAG: Eco29kI family restriction endonuclease [Phycisphaerae bacterium]|nr:Eco29kI family restriction endonuclease [Phycisphaerae bacterium]